MFLFFNLLFLFSVVIKDASCLTHRSKARYSRHTETEQRQTGQAVIVFSDLNDLFIMKVVVAPFSVD